MRKKKLDVVFDENVNERAMDIVDLVVSDIEKHGGEYIPTKSTVMRVAMHLGLNALNEKIVRKLERGERAYPSIRCDELRAAIGSKK